MFVYLVLGFFGYFVAFRSCFIPTCLKSSITVEDYIDSFGIPVNDLLKYISPSVSHSITSHLVDIQSIIHYKYVRIGFHGTSYDSALSIMQNDFEVSPSDQNEGVGMRTLGNRVYLSESPRVAAQYAHMASIKKQASVCSVFMPAEKLKHMKFVKIQSRLYKQLVNRNLRQSIRNLISQKYLDSTFLVKNRLMRYTEIAISPYDIDSMVAICEKLPNSTSSRQMFSNEDDESETPIVPTFQQYKKAVLADGKVSGNFMLKESKLRHLKTINLFHLAKFNGRKLKYAQLPSLDYLILFGSRS